jgi:hypothetical protein
MFYADFGMEIYDITLKQEAMEIMQQIGKLDVKNTKRGTILISLQELNTYKSSFENVSHNICDKLEPFARILSDFYLNNKKKIYMDICFVLTSEIDNCKIKLDKRLLQLANSLQVKIQFDGF